MAGVGRVVTVHGTFAHQAESTQGAAVPWWRPGSDTARDVEAMCQGALSDGGRVPVVYEAFEWSGNNSEIDRRAAGLALYDRIRAMEKVAEPYCLIGHSHGGSVIAHALLEAAADKKPLPGLKSWITVGTPFIDMHKLPNLFARLNLIKKVILVASLMLFFMFVCFLIGQLLGNSGAPSTNTQLRYLLAGVMMCLPAIVVIGVLWYLDWRDKPFYRKSVTKRAKEQFGGRWTSLWHVDDEAVQGLRSLQSAKFKLFAPEFAWQRMTLIAVFALPLAYLWLVYSPGTMVRLTNFFRDHYYTVSDPARLAAYDAESQEITKRAADMAKQMRDGGARPDWSAIRKAREDLNKKYPDNAWLSQVLRFQHQFFYDDDGKPCPGNILCFWGHSYAYNTKVLFHLVTDNVTGAVINNNTRYGIWDEATRALIPAIVVPIVSVLAALLLMLVIRWIAYLSSQLLAATLNRATLNEIKREIYGNDTDGEVAVGASPRPYWLDAGNIQLPADIADAIAQRANTASAASIAKFRNAISEIVLADGRSTDTNLVSRFLTWQELIHTSYFDLPEFRKLVARVIAGAEGFAPSPAFASDRDFARSAGWLSSVRSLTPQSAAPAAPAQVVVGVATRP